MSAIQLQVLDISGSRSIQVEAPDDVAIERLIILMVEKMNLPLASPDGQLMSYKLHHRRSARQLLEGQTLQEAGVVDGDELRLQPEITAGSLGIKPFGEAEEQLASGSGQIAPNEERFARFEAIQWWDQKLLRQARVLVVGAGALGNEVIKNLALLGVGQLAIVDKDTVDRSNLSRSVLFREHDEGRPKALCAAKAAQGIYPDMRLQPLVADLLADVGLGHFRWAQVVVGAVDNREARLFINAACARIGRPWVDGGIDVLSGLARAFAPPSTACYECTMNEVDWQMVQQSRSCSLAARQASLQGGVPTTPTTASVIGAIQAQEVVKLLHGMDALLGKGFFFEGLSHSSYPIQYSIRPDCGWHEPPRTLETVAGLDSSRPLKEAWTQACRMLGDLDAIDLSRELVERLECPQCGQAEEILLPAVKIRLDQMLCSKCGSECSPRFLSSLHRGSRLLQRTPSEMGLPGNDILWARRGEDCLGLEMADNRQAPRHSNSSRKAKQ